MIGALFAENETQDFQSMNYLYLQLHH